MVKGQLRQKKYGSMWQKIVNLKPNYIISLKIGSSGNDPEKINIPIKQRGPPIKYIQKEGDTCLILSLLNFMHYLGKDLIVKKLLEKNNEIIKQLLDFSMKNIIDLMTNQGRNYGDYRIKKLCVKKVKILNTMNIVNEKKMTEFIIVCWKIIIQ